MSKTAVTFLDYINLTWKHQQDFQLKYLSFWSTEKCAKNETADFALGWHCKLQLLSISLKVV